MPVFSRGEVIILLFPIQALIPLLCSTLSSSLQLCCVHAKSQVVKGCHDIFFFFSFTFICSWEWLGHRAALLLSMECQVSWQGGGRAVAGVRLQTDDIRTLRNKITTAQYHNHSESDNTPHTTACYAPICALQPHQLHSTQSCYERIQGSLKRF